MEADEKALRRDVTAPVFRIGERRGKWALRGLKFPYALFFVAAPVRPVSPSGFLLRSHCGDYSGIAPTSQLWHGGENVPLAEKNRPKNPQGGVMLPFCSWSNCLYHPVDRIARDHGSWATTYPELLWTADKDITFLLEIVHALLHCSDYAGADLPAQALELPPEFVDARADCSS